MLKRVWKFLRFFVLLRLLLLLLLLHLVHLLLDLAFLKINSLRLILIFIFFLNTLTPFIIFIIIIILNILIRRIMLLILFIILISRLSWCKSLAFTCRFSNSNFLFNFYLTLRIASLATSRRNLSTTTWILFHAPIRGKIQSQHLILAITYFQESLWCSIRRIANTLKSFSECRSFRVFNSSFTLNLTLEDLDLII